MAFDENNGTVRISMREIYDGQQKLISDVGKVLEELPRILARLDAVEKGVRWLKERIGWIVGGAMTVVAVFPIAMRLLGL